MDEQREKKMIYEYEYDAKEKQDTSNHTTITSDRVQHLVQQHADYCTLMVSCDDQDSQRLQMEVSGAGGFAEVDLRQKDHGVDFSHSVCVQGSTKEELLAFFEFCDKFEMFVERLTEDLDTLYFI